MSKGRIGVFEPLFSRQELNAVGISTASAKVFGNVVLVGNDLLSAGDTIMVGNDVWPTGRGIFRSAIMRMADTGNWEVLQSQFLDRQAVQLLYEREIRSFLERRVSLIHARASELVTGGARGTRS